LVLGVSGKRSGFRGVGITISTELVATQLRSVLEITTSVLGHQTTMKYMDGPMNDWVFDASFYFGDKVVFIPCSLVKLEAQC
jgi:hypothetical protein